MLTINTHRPALLVAVILTLGVFVGNGVDVPFWIWLIGALICLCVFLIQPRTRIILSGVFMLGALLIAQRQYLNPNAVLFLSQEECAQVSAVEGRVETELAAQGFRTVYELSVRQLLLNGQWQKASGRVQMILYGGQEDVYDYGDIIIVEGRLSQIQDGNKRDGFSYRHYMINQGVYAQIITKAGGIQVIARGQGNPIIAAAFSLRRSIVNIFYRYLDSREAAFVSALVLGERSHMPADLKELFVKTGTAHILAISGMNMSIVAAFLFFFLRLIGCSRKEQFWGTIIFLFAYAFLSGWSASVVRACIMSAVILSSFALEFESDPLNSLGAAAVILLVFNPWNLFDIGFQLSFAAVLGILLLFKPSQRLFSILPRFVGDSMALSLSAWVGTAGITLCHFKTITPVSILANIPIVPLADLVMALGLSLALVGGWCPCLPYAFAGCLKAILSAMTICAVWFSQIPWGHITLG